MKPQSKWNQSEWEEHFRKLNPRMPESVIKRQAEIAITCVPK